MHVNDYLVRQALDETIFALRRQMLFFRAAFSNAPEHLRTTLGAHTLESYYSLREKQAEAQLRTLLGVRRSARRLQREALLEAGGLRPGGPATTPPPSS